MDNKAISISVKDYLIRTISVRTNTPFKTIDAVITHQFDEAHKALFNNQFSVEISGFGKFIFNHKKAQKAFAKNLSKKALFELNLENKDLTEQKRSSFTLKLENTNKFLTSLKIILDGYQANVRRLEESPSPFSGYEKSDR